MSIPAGVIGPQAVDNPTDAGTNISLGSELQPNSDLSGTGGTGIGTGTVIGDIADDWYVFADTGMTVTASKDGSDYQVLSFSGSGGGVFYDADYPVSIVTGTLYKSTITLDSVTGTLAWRVTATGGANEQFYIPVTSSGTYTVYFIADVTAGVSTRITGQDGESCTISEASIKEVTLVTWDTVGTMTATNYIDYGVWDMQIVSDGSELGIEADIEHSTNYRYDFVIKTVALGGVTVECGGVVLGAYDTPGSYSAYFNPAGPKIQILADGACDVIIGDMFIYKLVPSRRAEEKIIVDRDGNPAQIVGYEGQGSLSVVEGCNGLHTVTFDTDTVGADTGYMLIDLSNGSGKWPHTAGSGRLYIKNIHMISNHPPDSIANVSVGFLTRVGVSDSDIKVITGWSRLQTTNPFLIQDVFSPCCGGGVEVYNHFGPTVTTSTITTASTLYGPDKLEAYAPEVGDLVMFYDDVAKNSEVSLLISYGIIT